LIPFPDDLIHVVLVTLVSEHLQHLSSSQHHLPPDRINDLESEVTLFTVKSCHALRWSADGRHLVCIGGRRHLKLCDIAALESAAGDAATAAAVRTFHLKVPATVLAVSPAVGDGVVAVGDVSGRITLIRCIGEDTCRKPYEKCVSTTLHWHAHGVNTLVFNHDGDYLYSGGEEGVLVSWQLRSGSRSFLPRLGAAVVDVALSPDAKCLAIACASNNIALVDVAASRVVRRVNGLRVAVPPDVTEAAQAAHSNASKSAKLRAEKYQRKQRYKQREAAAAAATLVSGDADAADDVVASVVPTRVKAGKPRRAAAGLHVIDGVCVLNGGPNTLQFFDVLEDRHVAELEVARGAAASHMFARPNVFTDAVVEHVAFSPDRLMLVTVDRRSGLDGTIGGTVSSAVRAAGVADDMQLKFWTRNDVNGEFELHTRVEHAHSGPVTRLLFHPASPPMVITASSDGRVRTWVRRDATAAAVSRGKAGVWTCRSTAEHRRGVAASDADLCSDGSLLAVVYGASVTLWSSSRVALLRTLTYPSREQPPLKSARFLAGSTLLATTTDNELHFWDLSSGLVVQSFRIGVAQIAVHPALPLLVVVTKLTEYGNSASLLTSGGGSDSMDDLTATGGDQHESGESSKRMPPLASQHLLLFDPTKRALPQCIYRNVVGFNRRQRRRDVLSPDALVTEIAFAHAAPGVASNALFCLSRGGILTCLQPADVPVPPTAGSTPPTAASTSAAPSAFAVPVPQKSRGAHTMQTDDSDDERGAATNADAADDESEHLASMARMSSVMSQNVALQRVYDGPSHAAPPLSALAENYLSALLRSAAPAPAASDVTVLDMDNASSGDGGELELVERRPFDLAAVEDNSAPVEPQECFEAFRVFFASDQF
jgi:WD40 repeat protein